MALEDDIWALNRLPGPKTEKMVAEGSFRYADVDGVVHRALWATGRWKSLCGIDNPTQKLQEKDPGAVTCIGCIGNGA